MKVKIATWNLAYANPKYKKSFGAAWEYYINKIDADIFLFQEVRLPKADENHLVWHEIGGKRDWGSGIYSKKYELSEEVVKTDFRGVFTISNTKIQNTNLTLISLYGLMESSGPTKGYSIPNLHRILSDLTGLFNGHISGRRNIVLGGDLNASVQLDPMQRNDSHRIFFNRLEDFKLNDCFKLLNKQYPMQTLRHSKSDILWQNDYFFVSKSISKKLINCEVIENEEIRKFSDHNIVIITLEI